MHRKKGRPLAFPFYDIFEGNLDTLSFSWSLTTHQSHDKQKLSFVDEKTQSLSDSTDGARLDCPIYLIDEF